MQSSTRYFIKLAYNGAAYHGWQMQNNVLTRQEVLEDGFSKIFSDKIALVGAGRTDAGVHAREFYAHFDTQQSFDKHDLEDKMYKLNSFLPEDIIIIDIFPVRGETHARFDAISRTYQYIITTRKDPFNNKFAWFVHYDLDVERMNEGAQILMEYTDFTSFSKLYTQVKTNNCNLMEARWEERDHLLIFTVKADRFLRNMVRAIVGTLVDLGRGRINIDDLKKIIEARDRAEAGLSVPGHGLFLTKVEYDEGVIEHEA